MKSKAALILVLLAFGCNTQPQGNQHTKMNNDKCPVTGNPVNNEDTYVHKGKEYKLCSKKCKKPLADEPDRYLSE